MKRLSYERKKAMTGRVFISIWIIGVLLFFVVPFIRTILYSVNTVNFRNMNMTAVGFEYFSRLFTKDTNFVQKLTTVMMNLLYEVPIIVMFSLFIAVLLNQKFVGRLFFRAVFFLPVIVMSGVVFTLLRQDTQSAEIMQQAGNGSAVFSDLTLVSDLLSSFGFGDSLISFISNVVDRVMDTVWKSGVQILLFLAGLQSISTGLYEAARIEGATKWEEFWKITFPMVTPILLVSVIYTIIDSFTATENVIISYINEVSFQNFEYSYGCAMSLTYCIIILVIIGLVVGVIGPRITYAEK